MTMKIDNLAEINRAATLAASKALSSLIGLSVTLGAVHLEVKKVDELFQISDMRESVAVLGSFLSGDVKGETILLMPLETALGLSNLLLKRERGTNDAITGEAEGVLKEVANIIIGNYLKEFAKALPGTTLLHGLSRLSSGPFSALIRTLLPTLLPSEEGLLIEVIFGFPQAILKGYLIFVFAGVEWKQ